MHMFVLLGIRDATNADGLLTSCCGYALTHPRHVSVKHRLPIK